MKGKIIQITDNFDPDKKYNVHITKQISKALSKLEMGKEYKLQDLIKKYDGVFTKNKHIGTTRNVFKQVMRVGKEIGVITEISKEPISFENFCQLDPISYMRKQLSQTKYKNQEAKTKHAGGGTRRSYSLHLWHFNNWLHGKSIIIQKVTSIGDNLQKIENVTIQLETVEDLLHAYQESNNGVGFERFIKEYLMDEKEHRDKSKGYMGNIVSSIKSYFEKNESKIEINFNVNVAHDKISESIIGQIATLSLEDLLELLTTGKPSIVEKAVVLCKFHSGVDNSTFADRLNFEAYPQLIKWFGTDNFENWDLEKCPVMINLTRIKVGFPHISCLDMDSIKAMQKALEWRYKKTGTQMKIGQAIFLNTKLKPITDRWISDLIPKLASRSGNQKTHDTKLNKKNEKTSHELRDLLKSTLNSCNVSAYASNHLIGHTPRDSYEKESILYPEKIREEFIKASKMLNLFTGFTNYVRHGDQAEKKLKEIRTDLEKIKDENKSMKNEREEMLTDYKKFKTESLEILKESAKSIEQDKNRIDELKETIKLVKQLSSEDKQLIRDKIKNSK